jgi:hypothetical protein
MKESFRSLDEAFNLVTQDYSLWEELVEDIDYIRNQINPSSLKKPSLGIERRPRILEVKNKEKVLYLNEEKSYGLKNYYNLVNDLIENLLEEQRKLIKSKEKCKNTINKIIIEYEIRKSLVDTNKEELYHKIDLLIKELKTEQLIVECEKITHKNKKKEYNNDYYYNTLKKEKINLNKFKNLKVTRTP